MSKTLLPHHRVPWKKGKVIGPGLKRNPGEHNNLAICLSGIDEHLGSAGATPEISLWRQISEGPYSMPMFISCVAFMLPGAIHLTYAISGHVDSKCPKADYLAAFGLFMVGISSPLCDAFCVYNAVYDDGNKGEGDDQPPYMKTAVATSRSFCLCQNGKRNNETLRQVAAEIKRKVEENGCDKQILAPDKWNNRTRLFDRAVCLFLVLPCLLYYMYKQRPMMHTDTIFCLIFLVAWITCAFGQKYRQAHTFGVKKCKDTGRIITESGYELYMVLHEMWHFLLVIMMTANAFYRPDSEIMDDKTPFWMGLVAGLALGLVTGSFTTVVVIRWMHIKERNISDLFEGNGASFSSSSNDRVPTRTI